MSSSSEKESFDKQLNPNSCSNPYDNADFRSKETTIATTQLSESSPQPLEFEFRDSQYEELTDSFIEFGSMCETSSSMVAQKLPPSNKKPATQIPQATISLTEEIYQELFDAAVKNNAPAIKDICNTPNVNINAQGFNQFTALHLASNEGNIAACQTLLQLNADVNSVNYMERTPLHLGSIRGHIRVVKLLVQHGANLNALDMDFNCPLHYAAEYGHSELVAYILTQGPKLDIKNRMGRTPAEVAASIEIAELFKEYSHFRQISAEFKLKKVQLHDLSQQNCVLSPLDFDPIQELGKGSFGEVYLVRKRDTGDLFAMKVLRKDKIMGQNLVKYAMTERNVLSNLRHPFIVGLNYAFQTSEKLFLILDYCSGGDLGKHLGKHKRFTEQRARYYLCEVLLALEELHKRDIIFRDLKPDNIVLDQRGHALLTDFGLSKEGVYDNYMARSFCGSVAYLTPEMIRRQGHGKAVDWYLLGVLLYEMLVGTPPYFSHNREELFHNIQRGRLKIPANLSLEAKSLLKGLLQRDPSRRLGSGPTDSEEIKTHPFFDGIDWESVIAKELEMPLPDLIEVRYGGLDVQSIYGDTSNLSNSENRFTGWTFISNS